jgi:hypothetical protein
MDHTDHEQEINYATTTTITTKTTTMKHTVGYYNTNTAISTVMYLISM